MKLHDIISSMNELKDLQDRNSLMKAPVPRCVFNIACDTLPKFDVRPAFDLTADSIKLIWETRGEFDNHYLQFEIDQFCIRMFRELSSSINPNLELIDSSEQMIRIANSFAEDFFKVPKEPKYQVTISDVYVGIGIDGFMLTDKEHALSLSKEEAIVVSELVDLPLFAQNDSAIILVNDM